MNSYWVFSGSLLMLQTNASLLSLNHVNLFFLYEAFSAFSFTSNLIYKHGATLLGSILQLLCDFIRYASEPMKGSGLVWRYLFCTLEFSKAVQSWIHNIRAVKICQNVGLDKKKSKEKEFFWCHQMGSALASAILSGHCVCCSCRLAWIREWVYLRDMHFTRNTRNIYVWMLQQIG